jgi:hypothetical protein
LQCPGHHRAEPFLYEEIIRPSESIHAMIVSVSIYYTNDLQRDVLSVRFSWSGIRIRNKGKVSGYQIPLDCSVQWRLGVRVFLRILKDTSGAGFAEEIANQYASLAVDKGIQ